MTIERKAEILDDWIKNGIDRNRPLENIESDLLKNGATFYEMVNLINDSMLITDVTNSIQKAIENYYPLKLSPVEMEHLVSIITYQWLTNYDDYDDLEFLSSLFVRNYVQIKHACVDKLCIPDSIKAEIMDGIVCEATDLSDENVWCQNAYNDIKVDGEMTLSEFIEYINEFSDEKIETLEQLFSYCDWFDKNHVIEEWGLEYDNKSAL